MAAEIDSAWPDDAGQADASMRPRRMAAEIEAWRPREQPGIRNASMRPRRMAAEIFSADAAFGAETLASMRPRRMAAEIRS